LVEALKLETNLPIETWDESGTTAAARAMGGTSDKLDARAAAVILQEFLDARNR
jgi:RNase H-fold protein (predicted Holliday junction resolvase)